MDIVEVLKSFGFTEYEARVLHTLLLHGELTAKDVAELSGIPRTSVYDVMAQLEAKGLISSHGKPLRFRAIDADELVKVVSSIVTDRLEMLKASLSKLRSEEPVEIRVYKGEAMLGILKAMVREAKEILVLLSYITDDMAKILNSANCSLTVVASNASRVKGKCYEFPKGNIFADKMKMFCHGVMVFDDRAGMIVFMNGIALSIVVYDESLVLFLKMLINSMIEFFEELRSKTSQNGDYRAQG